MSIIAGVTPMLRSQLEFRVLQTEDPLLAEQLQFRFEMPKIRYSVTTPLLCCLSPDPVQPNLLYAFRCTRISLHAEGGAQSAGGEAAGRRKSD
jgi:hypothetical protein